MTSREDPRPTITLSAALAALRSDLQAQEPPPSVLAGALRVARRRTRPLAWGAWRERVLAAGPRALLAGIGPWAGAATCAAVLGLSLLLALRPPAMPGPSIDVAGGGVRGPASGAGAGHDTAAPGWMPATHFVPLVSAERMQALAAAQGGRAGATAPAGVETAAWVVTTEVPQQRLAELGLPYDPGHAAEPVRAELLVAGSGEVLAVRFLLF